MIISTDHFSQNSPLGSQGEKSCAGSVDWHLVTESMIARNARRSTGWWYQLGRIPPITRLLIQNASNSTAY